MAIEHLGLAGVADVLRTSTIPQFVVRATASKYDRFDPANGEDAIKLARGEGICFLRAVRTQFWGHDPLDSAEQFAWYIPMKLPVNRFAGLVGTPSTEAVRNWLIQRGRDVVIDVVASFGAIPRSGWNRSERDLATLAKSAVDVLAKAKLKPPEGLAELPEYLETVAVHTANGNRAAFEVDVPSLPEPYRPAAVTFWKRILGKYFESRQNERPMFFGPFCAVNGFKGESRPSYPHETSPAGSVVALVFDCRQTPPRLITTRPFYLPEHDVRHPGGQIYEPVYVRLLMNDERPCDNHEEGQCLIEYIPTGKRYSVPALNDTEHHNLLKSEKALLPSCESIALSLLARAYPGTVRYETFQAANESWTPSGGGASSTLRTTMSELREKLSPGLSIKPDRKVGYRLVDGRNRQT